MRYGNAVRVAGLSLVVGFLGAATTAQADAVRTAPQDCTVRAAEPIEAKPGEQDLTVVVSAELPADAKVEFAETSNLKATALVDAPEANTHTIKVDASAATPGSFDVTIKAGDMSCKGTVTVEGASTPDPR